MRAQPSIEKDALPDASGSHAGTAGAAPPPLRRAAPPLCCRASFHERGNSPDMSIEARNKAVVTRYVEALHAGDYERLRALVTEDAVVHGVLGWGRLDQV